MTTTRPFRITRLFNEYKNQRRSELLAHYLDLRKNRDSQRENCTFKADPLPIWWLAKLYLALHYNAHIVQADSEFPTPRAEGLDGHGETIVQR